MPRTSRKSAKNGARSALTARYDAHHSVMQKTYGNLADLRRELSDSRESIEERKQLLEQFAACPDPQRSWLILDDYFEKLSLARKDFNGDDWWTPISQKSGDERLEETALVFLRSNRPLPNELLPYANFDRFAELEAEEENEKIVGQLENWLFPPAPQHLDSPRASLRVIARPAPVKERAGLFRLEIHFALYRPRTGEKLRAAADLVDLTLRSTQEQELFSQDDWSFILWLADTIGKGKEAPETIELEGIELLRWLARWGDGRRIEIEEIEHGLAFEGQLGELVPDLDSSENELNLVQKVQVADSSFPISEGTFFDGQPTLVLRENRFYLLRNAPGRDLLSALIDTAAIPVSKLSHRLLTELRKSRSDGENEWDRLCDSHAAMPHFIFEMTEETVNLRLTAISEKDKSKWVWTGREWERSEESPRKNGNKPEVLDDPRLKPAIKWLRQLDWFTPEPGLWIGDANEHFLDTLAATWPGRPAEAQYLGNPMFHRLFLGGKRLKPKLLVKGSGIDWFTVSAEWEQEGLKLTRNDLKALAASTNRFVKLPDSGWVELDADAVLQAHETLAELGLDGLVPVAQKVELGQAAQLNETALNQFGKNKAATVLREKLADFKGVPDTEVPESIDADLRPYQKQGFDFLSNLVRLKLGGILADDMGLGKTLQTLSAIEWMRRSTNGKWRPALVICPASVLHNWRREANRFVPDIKVLVLESGSKRHNLRKQIPEHDLIVTNYALLRRDLEDLKKFEFSSVVLDEAQFIKNPQAQVTQSVKQLNAKHRLALTGTPLENRILDLWSIVDFVQPGYLGEQSDFLEKYEGNREDLPTLRIARKRLSAKLRPVLLRRLKRQVAKDLPERIEERRDCDLGTAQRKLYLAELRRSREQVQRAVIEKGVAKSKMHVLAALTRLRQICCHPKLVGSNAISGKTETLFELIEPLMEQGQKVLLFSQFVQMLNLLQKECEERGIKTFTLTGETKNRQSVVNDFQEDKSSSVFLLSLRAAGTGLNLTTASYVVLYDPWWNPAVEAQAIDRSHRIGQTETVNAYKLITPGTVEEKIWELQQKKSQAFTDILGEEGFTSSLSKEDLDYLFSEED